MMFAESRNLLSPGIALRPEDALLWIYIYASIREINELRWDRTDYILLEETYPSVPRRGVVDIKKASR